MKIKIPLSLGIILFTLLAVTAIGISSCKKNPPPDITPVITSFTPTSGAEGTEVTITGKNFSATTTSNTVKINGTTASVTNATATQIKITVPASASTGTITVTVAGKTATSTGNFTIPNGPSISAIEPAQGEAGRTINIFGTNFTAASEVFFGTVKATDVTFNSAISITTKVPATAVTGKIKVTAGIREVSSNVDFIVIPVPVSFTPETGQRGTEVTLTGTGFAANAEVFFNDIAVATSDYVTREAGRIVVRVPVRATYGAIKLKQAGTDYPFTGNYTVTNIWELRHAGFVTEEYETSIVSFSYNNRAYLGMGKVNGQYETTFRVYNPATNTWSTGPAIPSQLMNREPRGVGAVINGSKVYISDGMTPSGYDFHWWEFNLQNTAEIRQLPAMPDNGTNRCGIIREGILFAGAGSASDYIYQFSPDDNNGAGSWRARIFVDEKRENPFAFVISDTIYYGGGYNSEKSEFLRTGSWVKIHDANGGFRSEIQPLPDDGHARGAGSSFSNNGKGYYFTNGGYLYEYYPSVNFWSLKTRVSEETNGAHAFAINGRIYAIELTGKVYEFIP